MKKIRIFEVFSGIGSQLYAIESISKDMKFEVKSLGFVEWYIDAIIAYQILNNTIKIPLKNEQNYTNIREELSKLELSLDSKKSVNNNFFKNIKDEKLKMLYPYLLCFLNTNVNKEERERKIPQNFILI